MAWSRPRVGHGHLIVGVEWVLVQGGPRHKSRGHLEGSLAAIQAEPDTCERPPHGWFTGMLFSSVFVFYIVPYYTCSLRILPVLSGFRRVSLLWDGIVRVEMGVERGKI